MGSELRITEPNTNYKVWLNALEETPHFRDDEDKLVFIDFLNTYAFTYSINLYCYSLEGKDIELCFRDEKGKISVFIQCVKGNYCKYYNKKYEREGTIYKDRFKCEIIEDENLEETIKEFESRNVTINDGSLINSTLDSKTVLGELCKHFGISSDSLQTILKNNRDLASIFTFCLRCFSSLMHKNIVKVLKCISVTMSSTLSLNGVKLIKGKYGRIYDILLMKIYSDESNYCKSIG